MINGSSCVLVVVLGAICPIGSGSSASAADELPERARLAGKHLEANAETVFGFAYPTASPATTSKPAVRFDRHRKLDDGFELTYTFRWEAQSRAEKESHLTLAFLFDADGQAEGILVKDFYAYIGEEKNPQKARYVVVGHAAPFLNDVSNTRDLEPLRDKLRDHPKVKDSRKHLRTVETASARELCELWLRLEQARK